MWKTLIEYCKSNPILTILTLALAAFILLLIVIMLCLKAKAKKVQKRLEMEKLEKQKHMDAEKSRLETRERLAAETKARQEAQKKQAEELKLRLEAQRLAAEEERRKNDPTLELEEVQPIEEAPTPKPVQEEKIIEKPKAKRGSADKKLVKEKTVTKKKEAPKKSIKKVKESEMLLDELKDVDNKIDFYEEDEIDQMARYTGKWVICRIITEDHSSPDEESYFFELRASNGEKLLSSEEYTTYNGALKGIETHRANILRNNFKISLSKKGDYIFKLLSGKNLLLCTGANYPTKARCESAIESVKRFAKTALLDENLQDHIVKAPVIDDSEVPPLPDGYNGKWIIESSEDINGEQVYTFYLYANNGEKLLSSEEYTTYIGAVNGIETHKMNIEQGNFRVTLTKRGDYIYKLLNKNGQLLSLGEHYKTKRRCLNAVESVKRFAKNSPVLTDSKLIK